MWNLKKKKAQQTSEHNERDADSQIQRTSGQQWRGGEQGRGSIGLGGEGTKPLGVRRATRDETVQHQDYSQYFIITGNGK